MSKHNLVKALWDLSNIITAFVVVQAIAFGYAIVEPNLLKIINEGSTKLIILIAIVVSGIIELFAILWCTYHMVKLDETNSSIYWQSCIGRMILIYVIASSTIFITFIQ